MGQVKDFDVLG